MGLQEYLTFCVQALERLSEFELVHVVTGNESCDLDSAVSALAYAYFLHETSLAPVGTALFLPLLDIPRGDFPLRTEIVYFLGKFSIGAGDLIFRDDLDLARVRLQTTLKLTLVDHHALCGSRSEVEDCVVQILDHRPKDGDLPDRCESTIELVGSCSTLVAEVLLSEDTFTMDPVCATLLYGTIVTDTINFSVEAGKATPKDLDLAGRLEDLVEGGIDRDALFEEIKAAKFDLSGLSSKEILRKDLKMVSGDSLMVAMSSVTMHMKTLMEREDFEANIKNFAAERKVDAVVLLTLCSGEDNSVSRQLAVFSPSRVYRQQMADILCASQSPGLELTPLQSPVQDLAAFSQGNVRASRKQVLPIIKAFLAGETTPDETQTDAYDYDLPKDQLEGFTSMSGIVGSRQDTLEGEITSEDLISRGEDSSSSPATTDLSPLEEGNLLSVEGGGRVFDPLSSVHSSDSGAVSPLQEGNTNALPPGGGDGSGLPLSGEVTFDAVNHHGGGMFDQLGEEEEEEEEEEEDSLDLPEGEPTIGEGAEAAGNHQGAPQHNSVHVLASGNVDHAPPSQNLPPSSSSSPPAPPPPILNTHSPSPPPLWDDNGLNNNNWDPPMMPQHNGLPEEVEEEDVEQDFLELASPHDLLFPGQDSPLGGSSVATSGQVSGQTSGQTSGQGSKVPSYPVTPPNSYMEEGMVEKEVHLPSFNSSEMVEKIHERKAALGGGGGGEREGGDGASGSEGTPDPLLSPFTPQNSYVDSSPLSSTFPPPPKETQLPSFRSSDMVRRIREKRSSMERDILGSSGAQGECHEEKDEEEEDSFLGVAESLSSPFTPHNSYAEGSGLEERYYYYDNGAGRQLQQKEEHSLPSLNSAEMAKKIRQKQKELSLAAKGAGGGQESPGDASPIAGSGDLLGGGGGGGGGSGEEAATPYTPQNSFRYSCLESDSHVTDLNEVAERLSLTGSESSGSLSEPKSIKASNRVHRAAGGALSPQEEPTARTGGVGVEVEMPPPLLTNQNPESSEEAVAEGGRKKGVSFSSPQPHHSQDSDGGEVTEEQINDLAFRLANEMLEKALEIYPGEQIQGLVSTTEEEEEEEASGEERPPHHQHSISDDSSPTIDRSDLSDLSPFPVGEETGVGVATAAETPDSALASSTESEQFSSRHFPPQPAESGGMKMSSSLADELAQALSFEEHSSASSSPRERQRQQQPSRQDDDLSRELSASGDLTSGGLSATGDLTSGGLSASGGGEGEGGGGGGGVPRSASYEIETEYLCDMDPMQRMGVLSHPGEASVIETDAGKEVVEGASFRKISGQEYKTVQEGVLEEIRQEARQREITRMQRSSVAEEATDDNDDDKEQGKTTLQPSDTSHPLLIHPSPPPPSSTSEEEENRPRRKRIPADDNLDEAVVAGGGVEGSRCYYESFAGVGSLEENAEGEKGMDGKAVGEEERRRRVVGMERTFSAASETSLKGVELHDEWQDDELPKMLGAGNEILAEGATASGESGRKVITAPHPKLGEGEGDDDPLKEVEVVDSDSEVGSDMDNEQLEWETRKLLRDDTPIRTPTKMTAGATEDASIPQYSAEEERRDARHWKVVRIGYQGEPFRLDMQAVEPYKRVLSHGGYCGEGLTAMIVFSACYLPSRDRKDYSYIMNHLFQYVLHTLDELVADDYMIVYFHGATPKRQMPSFGWLKKCYQGIDKRLKKHLRALYLVHPTLWLKTVVVMTRPFISVKFSSKLQFVRTLADLKTLIPMEYVYIPDIVQRYDDRHFHPLSSPPPSSSSSPVHQ